MLQSSKVFRKLVYDASAGHKIQWDAFMSSVDTMTLNLSAIECIVVRS